MESNIVDKFLNNCNSFPDCEKIPHFDLIRSLLYDLFVSETGLICLLLSHCYVKGKKKDEEFLTDPAAQIYWCRKNLPQIKEIAKGSRQIRNKLTYNEFLSMTSLKRTFLVFCEFYYKLNQTSRIITIILDQLYMISEIILGKKIEQITYCPLCKSLITSKINVDLDIDLLPRNEDKKVIIDDEEIKTLRQWKNDGYQEKLKNQKILIMNGEHAGCKAIFKSWSGTVAYVKIEIKGKKALRLANISIKILD